jgi:hypothetical protein
MVQSPRRPFRFPASRRDEEFVLVIRKHPAVIIRPTLMGLVGVLGLLLFSTASIVFSRSLVLIICALLLARGIWKVAQWWVGYIAFASNRVVFFSGLMRPKEIEVSLIKVFDMSIYYSLSGLFLGHGEFRFRSMSQERPFWVIDHVPYPPQLFLQVYGTTFPERTEKEALDRLEKSEGLTGRLRSLINDLVSRLDSLIESFSKMRLSSKCSGELSLA